MGKRKKTVSVVSEKNTQRNEKFEENNVTGANSVTYEIKTKAKKKRNERVNDHESSTTPVDGNSDGNLNTNTEKRKRRRSVSEPDNISSPEINFEHGNKHRLNKTKKIKFVDNTPQEVTSESEVSSQSFKKKKKNTDCLLNTNTEKRKRRLSVSEPDNISSPENLLEDVNIHRLNKPNKNIVIDNALHEAPSQSGKSSQSFKKKNKGQQDIQYNEEEEVKDEDIDKFCDELSEQDNVKFDNWVQLIEAKLHAPKNKSK